MDEIAEIYSDYLIAPAKMWLMQKPIATAIKQSNQLLSEITKLVLPNAWKPVFHPTIGREGETATSQILKSWNLPVSTQTSGSSYYQPPAAHIWVFRLL